MLKKNIENAWRKHFLSLNDNFLEIEGSDVTPKAVFRASGHLQNFADPMVKCNRCSSIYRADHLIKDAIDKNVEGAKPEELTKIIKESNIDCPKCKGPLGEAKVMNMMFPIKVGSEETSESYLRPETAQSAYVNFLRQFGIQRSKLPMGLAIVGKVFRNEISPRQAIIRQREFTQAELQIFFDPSKVNEHEKWAEIKEYQILLALRWKENNRAFQLRESQY